MTAPDQGPLQKFSTELLGVFIRWEEESDLDELDMAEAAVVVINRFLNSETLIFEPDFELDDEE
tara:strand:- start:467 stop:658 length:192 start_codon:yes stop_codon:yes gene_type:complete